MATDVEESDTDDHDRPDPPKRQRTRPTVTNVEHKEESTVRVRDNEWAPVDEEETQEFDEEERLSREKLKGWQAFQVAKGFVDNTINHVMEHYIMATTGNFFLEDPWMRSFHGDEMEDTAVSMAIRNHGLVPSMNNLSQANSFFAGTTVNYFSNQDYSLNSTGINDNFTGSTSSSSSSSSSTTAPVMTSAHHHNHQVEINSERNWIEEKTDESDQEHDFLERAVAEAIKKKGLSTLSVDYG
ncbi:uncharacterized protein LOC127282607 [Leptopilina boulardi]|uniref:uncharacterized protein LOC127282607 n=1 Tax=Leptopilina boulardi TaxID=63433 RepID=UPI0021F6105A|nr:uncharacterized protein LOC127282607 [Leptopilina boulardi]